MRKKITGIYKITNITNNKSYIGSSIDCYRRLEFEHKKGIASNKYLQSSIKKYGLDKFTFEVIECILGDSANLEIKLYLVEREYYWINYYNSLDKLKGYNLEIPLLNTRPDEVRLQISRTQRNQKKKHNTSGVVGVRWDKDRHKYIVTQSRNDKPHFLGRYDSIEEAKLIYDRFCNYDYEEFLIEREKILQRKPKTSVYFGVCFDKKCSTYIAQVRENKSTTRIGSFKNEVEAAIAYNEYILSNNLAGTLNILNLYPTFTEFNPPSYN